ncbi:DoxX family protein [Taklimakanibacter lacteus]|uniref:DoxX family protein n=1 Tax=Taklimakanibacter lacteus TaxID=2268456 RepID=UPI0034D39B08
MQQATSANATGGWRRQMKATPMVLTGRVLSILFVLFILIASVTPKLFFPDANDAYLAQLGWAKQYMPLIAAIEIIGVVLYVIPRTSLLGAVWMTGLLGGAIATQLRVDNPLFSHLLFGVYLGLFMWGGLWLRDPQLRALFPIRRNKP